MSPAILCWFLPGWLYRVTLKSTAWLWWPLAFLSGPSKLAKNPDWFHAQTKETDLARLLRRVSYCSLFVFVGASIWRTLEEGRVPDNVFLNVVGYAFSIDWRSTPWQLLGVAGAL